MLKWRGLQQEERAEAEHGNAESHCPDHQAPAAPGAAIPPILIGRRGIKTQWSQQCRSQKTAQHQTPSPMPSSKAAAKTRIVMKSDPSSYRWILSLIARHGRL